jgi:hypothetical protein
MSRARFSKKHAKLPRYVSYNFVIGGPAHPPSPSSFAVLQHDRDYGGQANAPTFAGLRRGKRIIGMTKLSIEEQDHEFEGASRPGSSFGVRRCSAAFEKPSQIENRCSPALIWSLLSHARPWLRPGRTRPSINFRELAPISLQRAATSKRSTYLFSTKGACSFKPGATPQVTTSFQKQALKARINRDYQIYQSQT